MSAPSLQIAVGEVDPCYVVHVAHSPAAPSTADATPLASCGVAAPGERQEPLPGAGLTRPAVLEVLADDVEPGDRVRHRETVRTVSSVWARRGVVTIELDGRYPTRWTVAADRLVELVQ